MDKKLFLSLLVSILLLSFISSETFKQSTEIDLKRSCTIDGSVCSNSSICNISIKYPNETYLVESASMTNNNFGDFNYTIYEDNLSTIGIYKWDMYCSQSGENGEAHDTFKITSSGYEVNESNSFIFFTSILFLLVLSILFFIGFLKIESKPQNKWTFFLLSFITFLSTLNLLSIVINDSLLNNNIASFFDTFTAISFLFYWFAFGLLAIIWILTMINTILLKRGMELNRKFGEI